jgi:hypothetical protein
VTVTNEFPDAGRVCADEPDAADAGRGRGMVQVLTADGRPSGPCSPRTCVTASLTSLGDTIRSARPS